MSLNGAILVNKPVGLTSRDVVNQIKNKLPKGTKIGHTGTLDPMVDGLLIVVIGAATKLINRLQAHRKTYIGEITFGFATSTEDLEGEVVEKKSVAQEIDGSHIVEAMKALEGTIEQTPPLYSAVKVNGKHLYEYARNNEEIERPVRSVDIYHFLMTSESNYDSDEQTQSFNFEAEVSSGTYIRTLAYDLGKKMGYPATMTKLTRIDADGFSKDDSKDLDQVINLIESDQIDSILLTVEDLIDEVKQYKLSSAEWQKVSNGNRLKLSSKSTELALVFDGYVKAIYQKNGEEFSAEVMLLDNGNN